MADNSRDSRPMLMMLKLFWTIIIVYLGDAEGSMIFSRTDPLACYSSTQALVETTGAPSKCPSLWECRRGEPLIPGGTAAISNNRSRMPLASTDYIQYNMVCTFPAALPATVPEARPSSGTNIPDTWPCRLGTNALVPFLEPHIPHCKPH